MEVTNQCAVTQKTKVVVIGAGLAGLTAARELIKYKEFDVTILEARDRVGGRIHTVKTKDNEVLELGATYVHGTVSNPIYDYAVNNGIVRTGTNTECEDRCGKEAVIQCFPDKFFAATVENRKLAVRIGKDIYRDAIDQARKVAENESSHPYQSLGNFFADYFTKSLPLACNGNSELIGMAESYLGYKCRVECGINGCNHLDQLDLIGFVEYEDLPGCLVCKLRNSYKTVIDSCLENISDSTIRLNHEVTTIQWNSMQADSEMQYPFVNVQCANGKEFRADHVIITVPLGVMKYFVDRNVFQPQLPLPRIEAIRKIGFGHINKLIVKFATPIPRHIQRFNFLPLASEENKIKQLIDNVLNISRTFSDSDWWAIWLLNETAATAEKANPVELANQVLDLFQKEYIDCPKFPPVTDAVVSSWIGDPYSRGSYSFLAVGSSRDDIEVLSKPLPIIAHTGNQNLSGVSPRCPQLLFAGEATDRDYYSTTQAAYVSGKREADRLIELYDLCLNS